MTLKTTTTLDKKEPRSNDNKGVTLHSPDFWNLVLATGKYAIHLDFPVI